MSDWFFFSNIVRDIIPVFYPRKIETLLCMFWLNFRNQRISKISCSLLRNRGPFSEFISKVPGQRICKTLYAITPLSKEINYLTFSYLHINPSLYFASWISFLALVCKRWSWDSLMSERALQTMSLLCDQLCSVLSTVELRYYDHQFATKYWLE